MSANGFDPVRVVRDLRALDELTGGPGGARRLCWTDAWVAARGLLEQRLAEIEGLDVARDAAGNLWAELCGARDDLVVVGSHLDSVPQGGWLDGALGVMAGLEILRATAAGERPARSLALVDWADEEGARFGRSLFGSAAFAGTLAAADVEGLRDDAGLAPRAVLAGHGVDLDALTGTGAGRRERLAAYLELHIEQGPVLASEGLSCAAVEGCVGVERLRAVFTGAEGHAGSTPMPGRRDAGLAAARLVTGLPAIAERNGGVATAGTLTLAPGVLTVIPGRAEVTIDIRHMAPAALAAMAGEVRSAVAEAAAASACEWKIEPIWSIAPVSFDPALVEQARATCAELTGTPRSLPSGALHDAAELARLCPAVMIFAPSAGGVSHSPAEDTPEGDLLTAIAAYGRLARAVVAES